MTNSDELDDSKLEKDSNDSGADQNTADSSDGHYDDELAETKADSSDESSDAALAKVTEEGDSKVSGKSEAAEKTASGSVGSVDKDIKKDKKGFFPRIFLFLQQVLLELKKVVRPTRKELINYTLVVLVFVVVVMFFIVGLDALISTGVIAVFSK